MRRRGVTTVVLMSTAAVMLVLLCAAAAFWRVEGGRWFDVRTASMGQAAPVGSLLLTRPIDFSEIRSGQLLTFHAPGSGVVYSHRVVARTATELFTRGDINPARDAWTLHQDDVVGQVVWHAPALGYLLRGLPALLLCAALVAMAASLVRRRHRASVRMLGASATVAGLGWVLHPWVALERLAVTAAPNDDGMILRVVSSGLLPIRVSAKGGGDAHRLVNGQVADVHVTTLTGHHRYALDGGLSLTPWWWIGIIVACLAPLLWTLVVGLEPIEEFPMVVGPDADEAQGEPGTPDDAAVLPVAAGGRHRLPGQRTGVAWLSDPAERLT